VSPPHAKPSPSDVRQRLRDIVDHLDHVLPGQAPILNFVHHNTLHGYQHLPFTEALESAERLTGIRGYLSDEEFRKFHAQGRILDEDLDAALADQADLRADESLLNLDGRTVRRRDIYRIALIHGIEAVTPNRLNWMIEELGALERFQNDVPPAARRRLLDSFKRGRPDSGALLEHELIRDLWEACLAVLGLGDFTLHPEELADLSLHQAENLLARFNAFAGDGSPNSGLSLAHRHMRAEARTLLDSAFADLGDGSTLRGLILSLTGLDVLDAVRPALIRFCASHLDEGLAAWHAPDRREGLYAAWRRLAPAGMGFALAETVDGRAALSTLPDEAVDAVQAELTRLGLSEDRWEGYLRRLALELPGWSGMVNWRHHRRDYEANRDAPTSLMDYLAIRLVLDRLALERVCREIWAVPAHLPALRALFERNLSEFLVRHALFQGRLPEYLSADAQRLIAEAGAERADRERWRTLADRVFTWKHSPAADSSKRRTPFRDGWRLFRLAQHLGLSGHDIRALSERDGATLLSAVDDLPPARRGTLWLCAYERRYRENLFNALASNRRRRGHENTRPEAQAIFCMDEREESIRRHLEELNPSIETLGTAGFFGIAMYWRALDEEEPTPLCPVVVTPNHEVRETVRPNHIQHHERNRRKLRWLKVAGAIFHNELRRNLFSSSLLIGLSAPWIAAGLALTVWAPGLRRRVLKRIRDRFLPAVSTRPAITAASTSRQKPQLGFTDEEQADRLFALLRAIGLTSGFAPVVAFVGHGSTSLNNPHESAHDCGACGGHRGGPNARVAAAMANRPEVRRRLAEKGIAIPDDTVFVGAQHDTCSDLLSWCDLEDIPTVSQPVFARLRQTMDAACAQSAHERCRRLDSGRARHSPAAAWRHVITRSSDYSQVRPEYGHAGNAAAVIGRRALSRSLFLDRRVFLISYDPTQDPSGTVLEGILLAAGPVGAGINLEYYFSTVNNERYGCGTKIPHNVTGLFGVMEGAASDLRTGLPRQMIEIHEAMRLQLVVEHKPDVLTAIYERQPPLQELIGNGWINVAALDPETGAIAQFVPGRGFVAWEREVRPLPVVEKSAEWYAGQSGPLEPALIRQAAGGK
jgi:uncharacterized protein YbcC (UPF0753/DUF2309 family)